MTEQLTDEERQRYALDGHPVPEGWTRQQVMDLLRRKVAAGNRPPVDPRLDWVMWWCDYLLNVTRLPDRLRLFREGIATLKIDALAAQHNESADVDGLVGSLLQWRAKVRKDVLDMGQVGWENPRPPAVMIDQMRGGLRYTIQPGEPAGDGRHQARCTSCGQTAVVDDRDLVAGFVFCQSMGRMDPPVTAAVTSTESTPGPSDPASDGGPA